MKIGEAKKIYSMQLDALRSRKQELTEILNVNTEVGAELPKYDRVELSQELSQVEKQYAQTQSFMEQIHLRETTLRNAEVAKQQGDAMAEASEDMIKCLEIARRISEGAKVPGADQKKLMEFSYELYLSAKNMALLNAQKEGKEYDSLFDEEEKDPEDSGTGSEMASDMEPATAAPELAVPELSSKPCEA